MARKEIYLYSDIYSFIAESVISEIEANNSKGIDLRVCSSGGNVFATYGIARKIKSHGDVNIIVDGTAMSSAANLTFFGKKVTCLNVSRFIFHRADLWCEYTEQQKFLDGVNADLKALMLQKVNALKWKEITGVSIEDMFNRETRIDVILTGAQAKEVGLVDEVVELTAELQKNIEANSNKFYKVAAHATDNLLNKKTMTIDQLKSEHPAIYKEVLAKGKRIGAAKELARVKAWSAFVEVDAKAVAAGIESGKEFSTADTVVFLEKKMKITAKEEITEDSPEAVAAAAAAAAEKAKPADKKNADLTAWAKEVKAHSTTFKAE